MKDIAQHTQFELNHKELNHNLYKSRAHFPYHPVYAVENRYLICYLPWLVALSIFPLSLQKHSPSSSTSLCALTPLPSSSSGNVQSKTLKEIQRAERESSGYFFPSFPYHKIPSLKYIAPATWASPYLLLFGFWEQPSPLPFSPSPWVLNSLAFPKLFPLFCN